MTSTVFDIKWVALFTKEGHGTSVGGKQEMSAGKTLSPYLSCRFYFEAQLSLDADHVQPFMETVQNINGTGMF